MTKRTQIFMYSLAFAVSFVFFLIWVFPFDAILRHAVAKESQRLAKSTEWNFQLGEVEASMMSYSVIHDFVLFHSGQPVLSVPKLEFKVALIPLLSGRINAKFTAHVHPGKIKGKVALDQASEVELDATGVGFEQFQSLLALMSKRVRVSLAGEVTGTLYYSWSTEGREGDIKLKWTNASLKHIEAAVAGAQVQFDDMALSGDDQPGEINLVIDNTQVAFSKFKLPGPDLGLEISGNVRLNRQNEIVRYMLDGAVTFGESFQTKLPQFVIATLQQQKRPDGSVPLSFKGSARKPELKVGELALPISLEEMGSTPTKTDSVIQGAPSQGVDSE